MSREREREKGKLISHRVSRTVDRLRIPFVLYARLPGDAYPITVDALIETNKNVIHLTLMRMRVRSFCCRATAGGKGTTSVCRNRDARYASPRIRAHAFVRSDVHSGRG